MLLRGYKLLLFAWNKYYRKSLKPLIESYLLIYGRPGTLGKYNCRLTRAEINYDLEKAKEIKQFYEMVQWSTIILSRGNIEVSSKKEFCQF